MNLLLSILSILPNIIRTVVAIEGVMQDAPGATKKALIVNAIQTATPPEIKEITSNLVDNVVATLNTTGVFKK